MHGRRWKRSVLLLLGGGITLQVGGCFGAAAPIFLSLAESSLLTLLFGGR